MAAFFHPPKTVVARIYSSVPRMLRACESNVSLANFRSNGECSSPAPHRLFAGAGSNSCSPPRNLGFRPLDCRRHRRGNHQLFPPIADLHGRIRLQQGDQREISRGWLRNRMEYGFDLIPIFVTFDNQRVRGRAFDPVIFRWNSSYHTARLAPYIEGAGGGLLTSANLPPGNTSTFNVTARGGGGVYIRLRNHRTLDLGVQWSHASNANLGPYNPQFNGVQLKVGYHFYR